MFIEGIMDNIKHLFSSSDVFSDTFIDVLQDDSTYMGESFSSEATLQLQMYICLSICPSEIFKGKFDLLSFYLD